MEQLIRDITTTFTNKLPDDKSFYTPDDLRSYDIPEFLVQRVEVEIYRNLNESIVPPHSEWADMSASDVENAWEQFIDAIVEEVRLPASFASTVFETAIADVMDMILKPRKTIPDILFGPKKKLSIHDLEKQLPAISVNSHLAQAVYKYMERKGLSEIEIGTTRRIVMKVDERITANYNSLNWAQLLQPLFILAGPKIDTELFRIFFRDRNMDRISRRFDLLNGTLNKIEFIETLSSPDLLNEEGYEDDQASIFDMQQPEQSSGEETSENVELEKNDIDDSSIDMNSSFINEEYETSIPAGEAKAGEAKGDSFESEGDEDEEEMDDDSLAGSFRSQGDHGDDSEVESLNVSDKSGFEDSEEDDLESDEDDEQDEDDVPLYNRFDEEDDESDMHEPEETGDQFADQFLYDEEEEALNETIQIDESESDDVTDKDSRADEIHADPAEESIRSDEGEERDFDTQENEDHHEDDEEEDKTESPIWQSYLGDDSNIDGDDIPEYSGYADTDEDDEAPLIDLTVQGNEPESAEHLIGWLKDDEDRFVSQIFSGSDKAYEEALLDLNQLNDWKQASRFIEKEIFARNLVDMYDEEAVDFTDRLQTYFDEYKS